MSNQYSFWYGTEKITFTKRVRISDINRILIKIHPDCHIAVYVPGQIKDDAVIAAVKKRSAWIWRQLKNFESQNKYALLKNYVSGESYSYLGKKYMLKVIVDPNIPQQVKLLRGRLQVTVHQQDSAKVKKLLEIWYKEHARKIFKHRMELLQPQLLWLKNNPTIRLLTMKKRWGSCSLSGCLSLNPHLVKAPPECIDYVLVHELCHLAQHNHSKRFYRLLKQVMPNWEAVKSKLDNMAKDLLAY